MLFAERFASKPLEHDRDHSRVRKQRMLPDIVERSSKSVEETWTLILTRGERRAVSVYRCMKV